MAEVSLAGVLKSGTLTVSVEEQDGRVTGLIYMRLTIFTRRQQ